MSEKTEWPLFLNINILAWIYHSLCNVNSLSGGVVSCAYPSLLIMVLLIVNPSWNTRLFVSLSFALPRKIFHCFFSVIVLVRALRCCDIKQSKCLMSYLFYEQLIVVVPFDEVLWNVLIGLPSVVIWQITSPSNPILGPTSLLELCHYLVDQKFFTRLVFLITVFWGKISRVIKVIPLLDVNFV